jgi:SpoVK/Ycf46/Vps4 family AAA+-type ATPase
LIREENFKPVLERLLATRRQKVEDSLAGARRGMRVLFTGHSGKNRLLAAQLFARELSVDLFQIDLERLVSKYIGETEKNLDALFAAAQASDAVLLFDDADQLLGERTQDTGDSGRFPNLDVAHLRQRIESYDGVVVFASDERSRVDPRITRQCDEVVELADD